MPKNYVSNSKESVRMFESDILEAVSKVHYSVPLLIFVPVILYFTWRAIWEYSLSAISFTGYFIAGLFIWSLTEYVMHRFIFHLEPKKGNKVMERIHFIFHGVHHDYPSDAHRLVMPPSVSIPLSAAFYFIFSVFLEAGPLSAFFAAFMSGYLFYDMTHYMLHHANFKNKFWKKLKKHHMLHHYDDATKGYGVSSPLWDKVFSSDFLNKKND